MSMNGTWTLHYSWDTGSPGPRRYTTNLITFNADGTFTGPSAGRWMLRDGTLMLSFNSGPAKYGGSLVGPVGTGEMSTFGGLNGCWYLVQQGTVGVAADDDAAHHDAAGNDIPVLAGAGSAS